jgi:hypothetical protein
VARRVRTRRSAARKTSSKKASARGSCDCPSQNIACFPLPPRCGSSAPGRFSRGHAPGPGAPARANTAWRFTSAPDRTRICLFAAANRARQRRQARYSTRQSVRSASMCSCAMRPSSEEYSALDRTWPNCARPSLFGETRCRVRPAA